MSNKKIEDSKISCNICYKNDYINNEFYICNQCKIFLCRKCKYNHNLSHNVFYYSKEYDNEITIQYKINTNQKSIRIFGDTFVKNNRKKLKIMCEEEIYMLTKLFKLKNLKKLSDKLEIKLKGINLITNMNGMFRDCSSIISISDFNSHNNIIGMSQMFLGCNNLKYLPDISKWNTSNVTDMSFIFYECQSLSSLPDISKWNTSNVTDMSFIFYECESLSSLPDISKWETYNVETMKYMFNSCKSLKSFIKLMI